MLLACDKIQVAPENTLYVGDHIRDIEAGLNAGNRTAAAAWGYIDADDDPANWGAHELFRTPSDLNQYLEQLL